MRKRSSRRTRARSSRGCPGPRRCHCSAPAAAHASESRLKVAEAETEAAKVKPTLARSATEAKAARPLAAQQPRVAASGVEVYGAAAGSGRISAAVPSSLRAALGGVGKNSAAHGRQRCRDKRVVDPVRMRVRVRVRLRLPVRMCGNGRTSKDAYRARRQPRKPNEACQRCPKHEELDAERPAYA